MLNHSEGHKARHRVVDLAQKEEPKEGFDEGRRGDDGRKGKDARQQGNASEACCSVTRRWSRSTTGP
jgi:hypothetical protein